MHQKIREWFNIHGRDLAALKIKGGADLFFNPETGAKSLAVEEWAQFLILTGQLDALIWIFHPEDPEEAFSFIGEMTELMEQYEEEAALIDSMSGIKNVPTGEA